MKVQKKTNTKKKVLTTTVTSAKLITRSKQHTQHTQRRYKMTKMMFTVAGVSTLNGVVKPRFSNDMESRLAMLAQTDHTEIKLIELPEAMGKLEAVQHLQGIDAFQDEVTQAALAAYVEKNTPKAAGPRGRPLKLPTLDDVPARAENGVFLSKEARQAILDQMIADLVADKAAARAKREARAAAKADAAPADAETADA
jgi:hypothetical protein